MIDMLDIKKDIKLADYSTFKIGGQAKEFVEAGSEEELIEAVNYAKNNGLNFFVFGGGSNVLFDDKGYSGLIIKIHNASHTAHDALIECGAGCRLSELVSFAKDDELSGLEWAAGIPGTVGGAIRGNAEAFGKSLADSIKEVRFLDANNLEFKNYSAEACQFAYRNSAFKQNNSWIIISVKIVLDKGKKEEIEAKMKEYVQKRMEKQPTEWIGSAGSFFVNPVVENEELIEKFEKETGSKAIGNRIPAGWLIDKAGLKGKKVGGMMVSDKNANFIINTGNGKSEEAITLASIIKQKVRNSFGVQLKEEVQYVCD